jgi:hypothetical protein
MYSNDAKNAKISIWSTGESSKLPKCVCIAAVNVIKCYKIIFSGCHGYLLSTFLQCRLLFVLWYPWLHLHVKLPRVFTHCWLQAPGTSIHSSRSKR